MTIVFLFLSFVDHARNVTHGADIVSKLLAQLATVGQIVAFCCVSDHGFLDADLPFGGVGDHVGFRVTSAGEKANIRIDIFDKPFRFATHVGQRVHQKQATGAVVFDLLFPKADGGVGAVGDHNDIFQLFKIRDQIGNRGRAVQKDNLAVLKQRRSFPGDDTFGVGVLVLTEQKGDLRVGGVVQNNTAVGSVHLSLFFQIGQISAHCGVAHIQHAGQFVYADTFAIFQNFDNLFLSF